MKKLLLISVISFLFITAHAQLSQTKDVITTELFSRLLTTPYKSKVVKRTYALTQLSKTINVTTAGTLNNLLTSTEKSSITDLIIKGNMDARDFKTLRDSMVNLVTLDIGEVNIAAYTGLGGTVDVNTTYSINEIPYYAFYSLSNNQGNVMNPITSIILPVSASSIGVGAFLICGSLTSVSISASITYIGHSAFAGCNAKINVDAANPKYSSKEGVLYNKTQTMLIQCPTSKSGSFVIQSTVDSISNNSFNSCKLLTSISIPSSVVSIGDYAFSGCSGLTSITVHSIPVSISTSDLYNVLYGVNLNACILNVPFGTKSLYQSDNKWSNFVNIVENPNGLILETNKLILSSLSGSSDSVKITSTEVWTSVSDQSWIQVSPQSGSGNETIICTAEANSTTDNRIALVTVSAAGFQPQILQVIQTGLPRVLNISPGGLAASMTAIELASTLNLKITGTIDARDFKTMGNMPKLNFLDLSEASIAAYNGSEGPYSWITDYTANRIPDFSFNFNVRISSQQYTLSSVKLPTSLTAIGDYAFFSCQELTDIVIPNSVTYIGTGAFGSCNSLVNLKLPDNLVSIDNSAYSDCKKLKSVQIPNSVIAISDRAFSNCLGLKSITVLSHTPIDLSSSDNVFERVDKTACILNVPFGTKVLYAAANQWKDFVNLIENPLVLELESNKVKLLETEGSNTSIKVFSNTNWTATSDKSWLSVDPQSGSGNNSVTLTAHANSSILLRTATVTFSAAGVPSKTFTVTQAATPKNVNTIAGGLSSSLTMDELSTISNLVVSGTIDARDFKTMRDAMPLLSILNINNATIIAYTGTEGTQGPYSYTYAANEIPQNAFLNPSYEGKESLTSVILPPTITSIEEKAFYICTNLTYVNIPNSVISIKESAFESCTSLKNITIGNSVTNIGSKAFRECTGLSTISIPSSVIRMDYEVFESCTGLTSIYAYSSTPLDFSYYSLVFNKVNKTTCKLYVPSGTKTLYAAAVEWKDFTNIIEMTTGISNEQALQIQICPNPVYDRLIIMGLDENAGLTITDMNGKVILIKRITDNEIVSVRGMVEGLYIARIVTSMGTFERKFVKK